MAEKTVYEKSLELHEKGPGKIEVLSKVVVENKERVNHHTFHQRVYQEKTANL